MLAAAVATSRQRWMMDGVFDRYWAKPSKKRGVDETPQPAKETMSKLGSCAMIIEPHTFDITLYNAKDPQISYQYPPFPPPPFSPRRYGQHSPNIPCTPVAPFTGTAIPDQDERQRRETPSSLPPFRESFAQLVVPEVPPIRPLWVSTPVLASKSGGQLQSNNRIQDSRLKEGGSTDPVIQMLATRAALDPSLKGLMKIVAAGNASPSQLKEFQSHIDELNTLLKAPRNPDQPKLPTSGNFSFQLEAQGLCSKPSPGAHGFTNATTAEPLHKSAPAIKTQSLPPFLPPAQPPLKVRAPCNKSDIHSIVFDFGGTGDRFSIPKFSILDYLPGGMQVIVSFLIIRRGSMAVSGNYKDTKSYYQTVTMRLSSHHPRTLEPLARIVAPPDEVRKYMDSVFDKLKPAETVFLPTRLPRSSEFNEAESKPAVTTNEIRLVQSVYSPPSSITPLAA